MKKLSSKRSHVKPRAIVLGAGWWLVPMVIDGREQFKVYKLEDGRTVRDSVQYFDDRGKAVTFVRTRTGS